MFLIRITPFTSHKIDTLNLRRIKRSGLYFGSSLVVSYQVKQTNHGELIAVKQASSEDERASSKDGQGNHECWPNLAPLFTFCTRFKVVL